MPDEIRLEFLPETPRPFRAPAQIRSKSPQVRCSVESTIPQGAVAQPGRAPRSQRGGHGFKSRQLHCLPWSEPFLSASYLPISAMATVRHPTHDPRAPSSEHPIFYEVLSHRFPTIRRADQILVLDNGAIVERGTHDELFRADGMYTTLARLQGWR